MILLVTIIACLHHKTSLVGVIDNAGQSKCVVELNTGDLIIIESDLCKNYKEGDRIVFYGRKE